MVPHFRQELVDGKHMTEWTLSQKRRLIKTNNGRLAFLSSLSYDFSVAVKRVESQNIFNDNISVTSCLLLKVYSQNPKSPRLKSYDGYN